MTGESQPAQWAPPVMPSPPKLKKHRTRNVLLIAGGAVFMGLAVLGSLGDEDSAASSDDQAYMAHAMCADFTRDRLKAPASADFPEYDDVGVSVLNTAGRDWTVRSYVDADNSFGADMRTSFVCVVRDLGEQWRLESWFES